MLTLSDRLNSKVAQCARVKYGMISKELAMNTYMTKLAKQILLATPNGLSKVRFAKLIYFVHKALVQKNLVAADELSFIRMPLGPVPVGFMELTNDDSIRVDRSQSGLSYNAHVYKLKDNQSVTPGIYYSAIESALAEFRPFSTSQLVEESHKEPSWLENRNGDEYLISNDDLFIPTPIASMSRYSDESLEKQHLQAQLLTGMLDEIVEESTGLEYPTE
jgi:uncharacterized phage-associated protein